MSKQSKGELAHQISKKTTEQVVKSKRDYKRNKKHKNKEEEQDGRQD